MPCTVQSATGLLLGVGSCGLASPGECSGRHILSPSHQLQWVPWQTDPTHGYGSGQIGVSSSGTRGQKVALTIRCSHKLAPSRHSFPSLQPPLFQRIPPGTTLLAAGFHWSPPASVPLTLSWLSFSRSLSMMAEVPIALSNRRCSDRRSESTRLVPCEQDKVVVSV